MLFRDGRLTRHKLAGQFLYCAPDRTQQARQLRSWCLLLATPGLVRPLPDAELMPAELRAAIVLFASVLDERQRRLFAGLESLKCGWGGDGRVAALLGIDPSAVAIGRRELVEHDVEVDRVRGAGGAATDGKTPEVIARLEALMARDGRRPAQRVEMDARYDRQDRRRTRRTRYRHLRSDRRPAPQGPGLLAACQPQEARRRLRNLRPAGQYRHRLRRHHHRHPAFAVDCIEKWWRTAGRKRYPEAATLQILADSGGSNGCRPRAWGGFGDGRPEPAPATGGCGRRRSHGRKEHAHRSVETEKTGAETNRENRAFATVSGNRVHAAGAEHLTLAGRPVS